MEISSTSTKDGAKMRRHSIGISSYSTIIPESKSNPSGQNQSRKPVPHYLRASNGSCHDFCKFGGRHGIEEEEENGSNKKKIGSNKGSKVPPWKDIVAYDMIPKISKLEKVALEISSAVTKSAPVKPKLIRPASFERPVKPVKFNLHRQGSMEISSTSSKPVVSSRTSLNLRGRQGSMEISSTSSKPVVSPGTSSNVRGRQGSMDISSASPKPVVSARTGPSLRGRQGSMEISSVSPKPVVSATSPNLCGRQGSMEISSTLSKPVVSARTGPSLRGRQRSMEISSSLTTKTKIDKPLVRNESTKAKKINVKKMDKRKKEEEKQESLEISSTENIVSGTDGCEEKTLYIVKSESPKINRELCDDKSDNEKPFKETKLELDETIEIIFEKEREKEIKNEPISENNIELNENIEIMFEEEREKKEIMNEPVSENNIELDENIEIMFEEEREKKEIMNEPVSENNIELDENIEIMFEEEREKKEIMNEPVSENNIELDENIEIMFEEEREKKEIINEPVSENNIELDENIEIMFEEEREKETAKNYEENKKPIESALNELVSENYVSSEGIGEKSESDNEPFVQSSSSSSQISENLELDSESESIEEEEESIEEEYEEESIEEEEYEEESIEEEELELGNEKLQRDEINKSSNWKQIKEEEKAYKLKFRPGRIIELEPDKDTAPKRLKFKKPRERNPNSPSPNLKKASYKKKKEGFVKEDPKPVESVMLRHQDGAHEKKEGQNGLFNNVIEETASKLVESRKSKVKALVGAFETVISLQDGKP